MEGSSRTGKPSTIRVAAGSLLLGAAILAACTLLDNNTWKAIREMGECGEKSDQPLPSNYDLVKATDAIVLVKVRRIGMDKYAGDVLLDHVAEFEVETVLKGKVEQATLSFFGYKDRTEKRREEDFIKPTRPGSGPFVPPYPCGVPSTYRPDARYLLFLVQRKEGGA